jgi:hypothetical protein
MAFIKLDRNIIDSYCFANPNHLKVWLWLLVKANFKKNYVPLQIGKGTTTILVDRGQLIFGRFVAQKELKMDGSMIYRILKKFKELKQIEIEPNNQYSIITICKYDSYQSNNLESEQQPNNQCTADEQQMNNECIADEQSLNTLKEGLECKEGKERESTLIPDLSKSNLFKQPNIPTEQEVTFAFTSSGGTNEMAEKFFNKYSATGWFLNGSPISNFKFLIPSFISNFKSITKSNESNTKLSATDKFNAYTTYADRFIEKGNASEAG